MDEAKVAGAEQVPVPRSGDGRGRAPVSAVGGERLSNAAADMSLEV